VHYAPVFERRNARHEAFAVSGNISAVEAAKVSLSGSCFVGCLSARPETFRPEFRGRHFFTGAFFSPPPFPSSLLIDSNPVDKFNARVRGNYDGSIKTNEIKRTLAKLCGQTCPSVNFVKAEIA